MCFGYTAWGGFLNTLTARQVMSSGLPFDRVIAWVRISLQKVWGFFAVRVRKKSIKFDDDLKASLTPSLTNSMVSPLFKVVWLMTGDSSLSMPSGSELPSITFMPSSHRIKP